MTSAHAILWDLDGVIVASGPFHFEAYRQVMEEEGRELSEEEFFREMIGLRNAAIIGRLLGKVSDEKVEEVAARKEEAFRRLIEGRIEALPGAVELATRARKEGIRQAIVSSTPRENIHLILRSLGLENHFSVLVGEEDAKEGKPHPEGFQNAAVRLSTQPDACVVIEDAPEGIEAGKAAGARCIGVATTRQPAQLAHADLVVSSLEDERAWEFIAGGPPA